MIVYAVTVEFHRSNALHVHGERNLAIHRRLHVNSYRVREELALEPVFVAFMRSIRNMHQLGPLLRILNPAKYNGKSPSVVELDTRVVPFEACGGVWGEVVGATEKRGESCIYAV